MRRHTMQRSAEVLALAGRIKPLLAGVDPDMQSAALADLLAIWLAGHPAQFRGELLALFVKAVNKLIPENELAMFGPAGHPFNERPN